MARLVGNRVVATGLSGRTDLNDALGTVLSYDEARDRCVVPREAAHS